MGYTKETLQLLRDIELKDKTIIELGSQDISLDIDDVNNFILSSGGNILDITSYLSYNYSRLSTKYLYDAIGIKEYSSIDLDGAHDSLKFNLNYNLQEKYAFLEQYDIVTNFGTTEHVFNQFSCFENIHNLCKVNGLIILGLPVSGYENHCFFNYHPTLFQHLADVNNYEILYVKYIKTSYYEENDSRAINVIFKKRDDSKFTMPIQNNINQSLSEKNIFEEKRILNNFKKLTGFELCKSSNIAIFGTAKAAQTVFNFVKIFNLNIVCFIDDFKEGLFQNSNIKIVSYDEFIEQYQDNTDLILQGNYQKGNIQNRDRLNTKVIELSKLITDSRNYESI